MTLVAEAKSNLRTLRMQQAFAAKQVQANAEREALQTDNIEEALFAAPKVKAQHAIKETLNPKP